MKKRLLLCAIASVLASGSMAAQAAQFWVTKIADTLDLDRNKNPVCAIGNCSLRDAINVANQTPGQNTIGFLFSGTYPIEIQGLDEEKGVTGDFDLLSRITIEGRALDGKTVTIDGQQLDRVFDIHSDAYVELNNLTILNGKRPYYRNSDQWKLGAGAGVKNVGVVYINDCILAFNKGGNLASALYNAEGGQAFLTDSKIIFNESALHGSAILSGDYLYELPKIATNLVISNSLIAFNTGGVEFGSGGIYIASSNFDLFYSKVLNNKSSNGFEPGGINIVSYSNVNISDSNISYNEGFDAGGIAIRILTPHKVTIGGTLIGNNKSSSKGGGVFVGVDSNVTFSNSTISSNIAKYEGGGIYGIYSFLHLESGDKLQLNNVTIADNTAGVTGGGLYGAASLQNTIFSNNSDSGIAPDCFGKFISRDYNLISNLQGCQPTGATANSIFGVSAQLEPLKDNGGPSPTHALLANSPAFDAGNDATCEVTDQRGVVRPYGLHCDIGAYERTKSPSSGD